MKFQADLFGWWIEPFTTNPFMFRGLLVGLLVVLSTSVVGTWVVLRGMSFLGEALAHGVLPGIAIAYIFGLQTTIGALCAAGVMVVSLNLVRRHSPLPEDTSIGVLFVGFLALAVVIMSSSSAAYSGDLRRFLFGSITGITATDLWRQAIAAVVLLIGAVFFYRAFLVTTFDPSLATVLGLKPRAADLILLALVAIAIVSSFRVVGNLLVFAFLVAPPAAASLLLRRVPLIMIGAVILGSLAVVLGLLISYHYDSAASATMALIAVTIFFIALFVRAIRHTIECHRIDLRRKLAEGSSILLSAKSALGHESGKCSGEDSS
ncbi:MAG: metal ABC transporter permease [Acidimicrobiaceae bacterium]|nr:metal ABC transporter permease [Acidimicrobiaceae bacterium]